ncbi:hypothetical protein H6P81_018098 [Aristolochia fimbriata]|uniref:Uncharacterized protein n=1 Tax=Aristolochia fimbriata TaxID=158543 RepID=A0AAV7E191_ARIFI|nr:hypothetical protein H6P81_018098 [Aristolochia fimbriata]
MGEALHKHIVLQLSRMKAKNNGYFTGCALAVTVWYYETMSRLGTFTLCTNKLVDPTAAPCVLKWDSNKVHRSGTYEEVHQQTQNLQGWEEGEGLAAHPPQADPIIAQLQDEVMQLKLKNATLESSLDGVNCIVGKMATTIEDMQLQMAATIEDMQLQMAVMQARLDGAPKAPAAEEAPTTVEEAPTAEDPLAVEDALAVRGRP